jgi:hypothetical protein
MVQFATIMVSVSKGLRLSKPTIPSTKMFISRSLMIFLLEADNLKNSNSLAFVVKNMESTATKISDKTIKIFSMFFLFLLIVFYGCKISSVFPLIDIKTSLNGPSAFRVSVI